MPITAKLSRNFYERLGDDAASELVEWFNSVDEEYRRQYREANDLNWDRFKAFHRAELSELRGEMDANFAKMRTEVDAEFAKMRSEVAAEFARMRGEVAAEFARMRGEVAAEFARMRAEVAADSAKMRAEIADFRSEIMKWMFIYWSGSMVTLGGLIFLLLRSR